MRTSLHELIPDRISYKRPMRFTDRTFPLPISSAPTQDEENIVLLYCPDHGGWHTGIYFDGQWRLHFDVEQILEPTHWLPAPSEFEVVV
jgi:hypothetical protein